MLDRQTIQQLREQGLTYQKIGEKFGVSRQRIHQILSNYLQRPEVKAYKKAYHKAYYQRPEVKARVKAYCQRPEVKAHKKAYHQRHLKELSK